MWASSSTRQTVGRRARMASTSISRSVTPRYSTTRGGMISRSPICCCGLDAAVGLDQADDDVDALRLEPMPFAEHRVGLADAGRRAQVDLEPAPRLTADQVEELLGGRAMEFRRRAWNRSPARSRSTDHSAESPAPCRAPGSSSSTLTRGGAPRIAPDRFVMRSIRARTRSIGDARAAGDARGLEERRPPG